MTVHVWTRKGDYVGYVFTDDRGRGLDFVGNEEHGEKVKAALMSFIRDGSSDILEVQASGHKWQRSVEFPSTEWVAVAAIMSLPAEGYRIHVILEAQHGEAPFPA
jgi:hypothetical protein